MQACLHNAQKNPGPIVVIVGGFHAAALTDGGQPGPAHKVKHQESYLVRYSFSALDALNRYGAGLPQPGYYVPLWHQAQTNSAPGLKPR